ncbi:protein phosphatase PTC7 homolog fig-like [Impatiens glandulifera]|uniref:protein phosphatase PTC7 homolog fig-like n=1 Tax=Impatiens glandulifera TaxID=253017 RepID=UPI001FB14B59|nr:protein phosphatase PTC7 homolog fig-like [Impatiens glandulifera]
MHNPDAEVIALLPETLLEIQTYVCSVCNIDYKRIQNLSFHMRKHNLPLPELQETSNRGERGSKVYICPEPSCKHHDPKLALGDITGIKKHYARKHGKEKNWKCPKCLKKYALESDLKAHVKICDGSSSSSPRSPSSPPPQRQRRQRQTQTPPPPQRRQRQTQPQTQTQPPTQRRQRKRQPQTSYDLRSRPNSVSEAAPEIPTMFEQPPPSPSPPSPPPQPETLPPTPSNVLWMNMNIDGAIPTTVSTVLFNRLLSETTVFPSEPKTALPNQFGSIPSSSSPPMKLKIVSGSCYLPNPNKEETGGDDAHFICPDENAIGVADGVEEWDKFGVDSGEFAREVMFRSVAAIREEPRGSIDTFRVLKKAHALLQAEGSSTVCIIALTERGLHAVNLGDSGFMVIRDECTVFKSPPQQHAFNRTYHLAAIGNGADLPSSAQVFSVPVIPGDVIIAGSDGLFDNLYSNEIISVAVNAIRAGLDPEATAQKIAASARQSGDDKMRSTPFSTAAQNAGFRYSGGKLDDITVLVSFVKENAPRPLTFGYR